MATRAVGRSGRSRYHGVLLGSTVVPACLDEPVSIVEIPEFGRLGGQGGVAVGKRNNRIRGGFFPVHDQIVPIGIESIVSGFFAQQCAVLQPSPNRIGLAPGGIGLFLIAKTRLKRGFFEPAAELVEFGLPMDALNRNGVLSGVGIPGTQTGQSDHYGTEQNGQTAPAMSSRGPLG